MIHRGPLIAAVTLAIGCGDAVNPPIRDVVLAEAQTFTRDQTIAGDPIRLHLEVDGPTMIQFRAWSAGYLIGAEARVTDSQGGVEGSVVQSAGTQLRIDGLRLEEAGEYTIEVTWILGSGLAGYRYTVLSTGSSPLHSTSHPMKVGRIGHQATLLPDGTILVTGGMETGTVAGAGPIAPVISAERVDPALGRSEAVGDMAQARAFHTAILIPEGADDFAGKVLLLGGIGPKGEALLSTEVFDPLAETFTAGPFLPQPRAFMGAVWVDGTGSFLDRKVVLGGGERTRPGPQNDFASGAYTEIDENPTELLFFDPDVGTIQSFDQLVFGRLGATMTLLPDGKILFVGGGVDTIPSMRVCDDDADQSTCRCSTGVPLCTEYLACAEAPCPATSYTRKDIAVASVEIYNATTGAMVPKGQWPLMNRARAGHAMAVIPGGLVVVAGGATAVRRSFVVRGQLSSSSEVGLPEYPTTMDSVEVFDPVANEFRLLAPLAIPREQHAAVVLGDGRTVLVGGFTPVPGGLRPVSLIEVLDPSAQSFLGWSNLVHGRAAPAAVAVDDGRGVAVFGGESAGAAQGTWERIGEAE